MPETFILDKASNPHDRLLKEALMLRARVLSTWDRDAFSSYLGFLAGMCAATGCSAESMTEWLEFHA